MSSGLDTAESVEKTVPVARPATWAPGPGAGRERRWRKVLGRVVVASDLAVITVVSVMAIALGLHDSASPWGLASATRLSLVGAAFALGSLAAFRAWEPQVLGQGSEEFNRIFRAFVAASLLLALAGMALKDDTVRPWVFGVLPAAGAAVLGARYVIRRLLHQARREGLGMSSVLVVGSHAAVADLVARTRRVPHHGWTVTAACTSTGTADDGSTEIDGVPVVGDLDEVARRVHALGIDVVAIAPTPGWTPTRLHRLAWDVEGYGVELVVDPGLMEITGPRLHVAPVDGLPLLRLTEPRWGGPARIAKNLLDRSAALSLVALFAPVFLTLAILIKRDGGPVFYRQERVGRAGRAFRIIKFRSMVVGADHGVDTLAAQNDGFGPLFKMKADPRITGIGKVLRRFSLDEVPQLFNVIAGTMSLVGPRPPLQREVATYADDARRKLLVRPGMTGLWQVNGRSDLSWEESVRLDLRYVENWSPALDASILWKTIGAVFRGRGAY